MVNESSWRTGNSVSMGGGESVCVWGGDGGESVFRGSWERREPGRSGEYLETLNFNKEYICIIVKRFLRRIIRKRERKTERERERERKTERERRRGGGVLHRPLALRVRGRRVESYNFIMEVKIQEIAISTNLSSVQSGSESPEGQALSVISL